MKIEVKKEKIRSENALLWTRDCMASGFLINRKGVISPIMSVDSLLIPSFIQQANIANDMEMTEPV